MKANGKKDQRFHKTAWLICVCLGILGVSMGACTPTPTPFPTQETKPTATITSSPTSTVEWFPATSTPTSVPTFVSTPTPVRTQELGNIIFSDDFSEPGLWLLGSTSTGIVSLGVNELTIAIAEPGGYDYSIRSEPQLGDFQIEITTNATLCQGEDQYGLLLRMSAPGSFYRYALSCDGRVRLDKVIHGTATSPQPWIQNNSLPPGAPLPARLGVRLHGEEMLFFINGQYQFTVIDPALQLGNIGFFARSVGDNAVTVNFSDLVVRHVIQ